MSNSLHICCFLFVLSSAAFYWHPCSAHEISPQQPKVASGALQIRATCPAADITPCTCTVSSSANALPELTCINHAGDEGLDMDRVFQSIDQNSPSKEYQSLLLVNNRLTTLNYTLFGDLQFRSVSLYDTNFTSVAAPTFSNMASIMTDLLIKGDRLSSIFPALQPLTNLKTLTLNLGLRAFKIIPGKALADLPQLQQVTLNGVANLISSNAFSNLPSLQWIKINNQVEMIQSDAFLIDSNTSVIATIDLSGNRLDENSFGEGFIRPKFASSAITLDLSSNSISFLPENVFKPFLAFGNGNRIVMRNGGFMCGKCDSYWIIKSLLPKSKFDINCYQNGDLSVWDYDWSKCGAAALSAMGPVLLLVSALQLLRLFAH